MKKLKFITLFSSSFIICSSCLMMNIAGCRKKTYTPSFLVTAIEGEDKNRVYNI